MELRDTRTNYITVRKRLFVMVVLLSLVSIGIALYATLRISETNEWLEDSVVETQLRADAVESARTAQVHFKKQVQEWKNVLLRGGEPGLFEKYFRAFEDEERAVRTHMTALRGLLEKMQLPLESVDAFLAAHTQLAREYREALESYDTKDPTTAFVVDRQVRGIDRAPTDAIDTIVRMVHSESRTKLDVQGQLADAKMIRDRHFLQGVVILVANGIVLGIFFAVTILADIRNSRVPAGTDESAAAVG